MEKSEVTYYESRNIGKGLPFAYVGYEELIQTDDIYTPSLRDFHVVFWFKKGVGKYYVDFQEYTFKPNTLILLSKDQLHYFERFDQANCEIQSITFSPEFVYRNDCDIRHLFQFDIGSHLEGLQILSLRQEEQQFLRQVSEQLDLIYNEWDGISRENGFYHGLCLFLSQCELIQQPIPTLESGIDESAKLQLQFTNLLERHFHQEFKVEFYLDKMGITVKALSKITKDKFKLSPKAVIDQRRVLEIKRQLRGTSKASKTIAYELGFGEPTNLFKYFKKHTGMTPQEFKDSQTR